MTINATLFITPLIEFVTGKIIEVDGGLQSPNLEMPIPDL